MKKAGMWLERRQRRRGSREIGGCCRPWRTRSPDVTQKKSERIKRRSELTPSARDQAGWWAAVCLFTIGWVCAGSLSLSLSAQRHLSSWKRFYPLVFLPAWRSTSSLPQILWRVLIPTPNKLQRREQEWPRSPPFTQMCRWFANLGAGLEKNRAVFRNWRSCGVFSGIAGTDS